MVYSFLHRGNDIILYLKDPKISTKKSLLDIIHTFSKAAGYKINIQKSVAFLYTNNKETEKEFRKTIPFVLASKK
jgi:predicted metal-dependent RNase